jgi:uncharacterized membrane protein YkgB
MVCSISCSISLVFIIAMIYFYNATSNNEVVKHYKSKLPSDLQVLYDKIAAERQMISYKGFCLGFVISLFIILYNVNIKSGKLNNTSIVCIVVASSFLTNYFFYMLSPKSKWMLNYLNDKEQVKAWLQMYKAMQFNYHLGLVLGIIGVGIFAFAFRC